MFIYKDFRKSFCLFLVIFSGFAFAESQDFLEGERLFKEDKCEEAIPFLISSISEGLSPKSYVYLALCYEKMGLYKESLDVCTDGMKVSGTDKKVLAFNAGNVCFALEDYETAEKWYSLAIAANRLYAPPVLNRANAELKQEKYLASLEDYKLYLDLSPNDSQKEEIEQVIALLEGYRKAEEDRLAEEKRLLEEEALILAAQQRQAAEEEARAAYEEKLQEQQEILDQQQKEIERLSNERQKAEEDAAAQREADARKAEEDAARRRKLLEDVASSLKDSKTSDMSAGAEGTIDYGYESKLE